MAVKSIVEVGVQDDSFKEFSELFEKYRTNLAKLPGAWANVDKSIKSSFEATTAALLAQGELTRKRAADADDFQKKSDRSWFSWLGISRETKKAADNIFGATKSLLKWAGIGTAVTGLLGIGGLWGIDELAAGVSGRRRSALGLGISYGEQSAFNVGFSRFVDPGSFLSSVNAALTDPSQKYRLLGLGGLSQGQIQGKDAAQVGAELLVSMKRLADRTPTELLASVLKASGKDQFFSVEDFQRIKNTPWGELSGLENQFPRDAKALGLSPANQLAWQKFTTQMQRAGSQIENVFVRGLAPLAGPLTELSTSFARAIGILFSSDSELVKWIPQFGKGIEHFAKSLAAGKFDNDIKEFIKDVGIFAGAIKGFATWLYNFSKTPVGKWIGAVGWGIDVAGKGVDIAGKGAAMGVRAGTAVINTGKSILQHTVPEGPWGGATNGDPNSTNPGNMRLPGQRTGYAHFAGGPEAGIRRMAWQLLHDENVHGLTTLRQIIGDNKWGWAPASDRNDVGSYVRDVSQRSGLPADARLDLGNEVTLSKLIAAMTHHENPKTQVSVAQVIKALKRPHAPLKVAVHISSEPGGNPVIQSNMAAR